MARIANEQQQAAKRKMIIEKAREVFCQKGFLNVTMKDIVEACGISRGGLYLFFSSVEELFEAVISNRNVNRFEEVRKLVLQNADFSNLLDLYFNMTTERILSMDDSILMATYEFYSVRQTPSDLEFRDSQIACIKKTILDILELGVKQGAIVNDNIEEVASNYLYLIEGMSVFGMFNNISETDIQVQIQIMKSMLKRKEKGE